MRLGAARSDQIILTPDNIGGPGGLAQIDAITGKIPTNLIPSLPGGGGQAGGAILLATQYDPSATGGILGGAQYSTTP